MSGAGIIESHVMQGTLGLGSGKAAELQAAVAKANARALKNLFFVPRYCASTIYQKQTATFGKAKVIMYPRSTGAGVRACNMVNSICSLAGIRDIGVKVWHMLACILALMASHRRCTAAYCDPACMPIAGTSITAQHRKLAALAWQTQAAGDQACHVLSMLDCWVQIHGTRNARNIAKALITAFEAQVMPEELADQRHLQSLRPHAETRQSMRARLSKALMHAIA